MIVMVVILAVMVTVTVMVVVVVVAAVVIKMLKVMVIIVKLNGERPSFLDQKVSTRSEQVTIRGVLGLQVLIRSGLC